MGGILLPGALPHTGEKRPTTIQRDSPLLHPGMWADKTFYHQRKKNNFFFWNLGEVEFLGSSKYICLRKKNDKFCYFKIHGSGNLLHRCVLSVSVYWLLNILLFLWEYELHIDFQNTTHLPAVNHAGLCRDCTSTNDSSEMLQTSRY